MILALNLSPIAQAFGFVGGAAIIFGLLRLARAIDRTQGLAAWRAAAEGYKEQVLELTGRLDHAEREIASLLGKVETLERRPDMSTVIDKFEIELRPLKQVIEALVERTP